MFYTEEQVLLKIQQYTNKLVAQDVIIRKLQDEKAALEATLAMYRNDPTIKDIKQALESAQAALEIEINKVK